MENKRQVVNVIKRDENGLVILDEKNLKKILLHNDAKGYPIAFYSICGSNRTGKSFLWNQFIRYLKNKNNFLQDIATKKIIEKVFDWKAGVERHTEGILICKEPFFLETSKYGKVALFLMDTQGMFDNVESGENSGMIVALSFLISSFQVFNVIHEVQSCHLHYCYKFSNICQTLAENNKNTDQSHTNNSLMFIVRDWRKKRSYKLGLEGGKKYVDDMMEINDEQAEDQRHVRRELKENFLDVSGCLLPEPGDNIVDEDPKSSGCCLNDIAETFYQNIQSLFEYLCREENVVVKIVGGRVANGYEVYKDIVETAKRDFTGVAKDFRSFVEHDYKKKMKKLTTSCLKNYVEEMCNAFQNRSENSNVEWKKLFTEEEKSDEVGIVLESDEHIDSETVHNDSETDELDWSDWFVKCHVEANQKVLDQYDQAFKPGTEMFIHRWKSILKILIVKNYIGFENCVKAEILFNTLMTEYNNTLRSDASSEGLKRFLHPFDSAKERAKVALKKFKKVFQTEIDESISEQCYDCFHQKANILLEEHLRRIALRIGMATLGILAVVAATVLKNELNSNDTSRSTFYVSNQDSVEVNFTKPEIAVSLSFGVVKFFEATELDKNEQFLMN